MSACLSAHLPLLASAPGGIQKLRALILELAVRGKLVPQDANDEPASELLKRIAKEKARLVAEGKIRKDKPLAMVRGDEKPFELPAGWEYVPIAVLCAVVTDGDHLPPPRDSNGVPFLVIGDVRFGNVKPAEASRRVSKTYFDALDWTRKPQSGDVLLTTVGSYGIPILVETDEQFCFQRHIALLRPALGAMQFWIHLVLGSPQMFEQLTLIATGIAQKTVPLSSLRVCKIPLPPLAEQHRIVAKVNEVMALCDRLEADQADAASAHANLVQVLLGTLAQSRDAAELAANWQRLSEHFDIVLSTEASLDALKQTILQLAVMGRLVPQDPNDEPASELLKRMRKCVTKKMARVPNLGAEKDGPTALPTGWEEVTFPELCEIGGGATPSKSNPAYWGDTDGLPWVSPKDMKVDEVLDSQDHVTLQALKDTRLPRVPTDSVLIVVRGMILAHSFPVAVTKVEVTINQDMKSLTPMGKELTLYLALAFKGFTFQILRLVERSTHGTCKLQSEKLFAFRFGLPPLHEQHRIVAKVDELMTLCDRLKSDLAESRARQARLASTLIESALKAA